MKLFVFICLIGLALRGAAQTPSDSSVAMRFRIYYPVGKSELREDYMENAKTLQHIQKYLEHSSKIDSITIYSYASPEGPYQLNKRLATNRGKTIKNYLLKHLPAHRSLSDHFIIIDPTAENWSGLRDLVFYQYPYANRDEVLAVLDRTDIGDERRKALLKRLDGGKSWKYMLKHLMPQLRYATWVTVWQRLEIDKPLEDTSLLKMDFSEVPLSNFKPISVAAKGEKDAASRTLFALKTNLLYDAVSWLNFSIEVPVKEQYSLLYYHQFPWWTWGKNNNEYCMRFLSIGAEGRWWFKPTPLKGHFVGIYAESGKYDFEHKRDICYQGEHWSTGLSYGYAMPIGKRLNLEFSISAGYASIAYRGYTPSENYEILWRDPDNVGRWHYIGPTKAQVSLVFPFVMKGKKGGVK